MKHKQLPWMADLKVGDVLWNRNKTRARIVREVSRFKNGDLNCVTFAISRCSWTGRCYTVLGYTDLMYQGYHPAPLRAKLDRLIDFHIAQAIKSRKIIMTCCDVQGVP